MEPQLEAVAPRRSLSRAEFDRMVELGFFEGERVELLRGVIFTTTQGPTHSDVVDTLAELLILALRGRAKVRVQNPLAATDDSEPEPDLAIVRRGRCQDDHPDEAFLVIEVADSSLEKDRKLKGPLYAEMGVAEYWIIDIAGRAVEVHTQPSRGRYRKVTRYGRGKSLSPASFPDLTVSVNTLFA